HLENALRVTDAHEVARVVLWEELRGCGCRLEHLRPGLADREPAERVAVEADLGDLDDRASTKLGIRAALGDAEQQLAGAPRRPFLTQRPERRQADRFVELGACGVGRR